MTRHGAEAWSRLYFETLMFQRIAAAGVALLVLFHAWLFAGQALDGRLADPAVLARWGAAALLLAGLEALRRTGASLFRGRRAVGIWLLVALLHAPAAGERLGVSVALALPEAAATLVQAGAIATGLLVLLWLAPVPRHRVGHHHETIARAVIAGAIAAHAWSVFAPRPPPSA